MDKKQFVQEYVLRNFNGSPENTVSYALELWDYIEKKFVEIPTKNLWDYNDRA